MNRKHHSTVMIPRIAVLLAFSLLAIASAASSVGAPVELPPGAVILPSGGVAVPLRLDTPAEYTADIHARVLAAGEKGLAYDVERAEEVAVATDFLFIRPGAWMWSPSWCTMNFIYGSPGSYQIGSAGHCNNVNSDVVLVVYPGVFANIGRTSASHNNGPGDDYSLVNIRSNFQQYVDANVADIWGPQGGKYVGQFNALGSLPAKHVGHGTAIGTGGTPRAAVAFGAIGTTGYCECAIAPGDSGSPFLVITPQYPLGQGFMVITHLAVGSSYTGLGTLLTHVPSPLVDGDINPLPPA